MKKTKVSPQTEDDALAIAKATQKPNQTKEQTKLIAKGIEKGIAEYKKRHKEKARELDKKRKKLEQQNRSACSDKVPESSSTTVYSAAKLTITLSVLLLISIGINVWQFIA